MNRVPLAPRAFMLRLAWFEFTLACVQLFHLAVLSMGGAADFAVWAAVHGIAQASLWVLRRSAGSTRAYPNVPWRPLLALLLLTGSIKLFSRMPYITAWLAEGLQATRSLADEQQIDSGMASYLNVFFYPLAILAAITTMPRRIYWRALGLILAVSLVDLVFIGTRNAPTFVLLFHVLLAPVHLRGKRLAVMGALLAGFIALFGYSTVNRTADAAAGNFDWLVLFEFTKSSEVLRLDPDVVQPLAAAAPSVLPAVFLTHYMSHSVAELAYLLERRDQLETGNAYHLVYQLCVVKLCSQEDAFAGIERTNPRAGVYQTAWGSLILDFTPLGATLVWVGLVALVAMWQLLHPRRLTLGVALATQLIVLGSIENYLYNGLGLVQIVCIFVACSGLRWLRVRKPRRSARPPSVGAPLAT